MSTVCAEMCQINFRVFLIGPKNCSTLNFGVHPHDEIRNVYGIMPQEVLFNAQMRALPGAVIRSKYEVQNVVRETIVCVSFMPDCAEKTNLCTNINFYIKLQTRLQ